MKKKNVIITAVLAVITVALCALFILVDRKPIGPNETVVGCAAVNGFFANLFKLSMPLYKITNILGYLALAVCGFFGLVGLLQLIWRKDLMKVDKQIIALGVFYVVVLALYVIFEKVHLNYRPVIMPSETAPEASFPSSHTMLALTVFGSAPMVLKKYLKDVSVMQTVTIVFLALAVVTVIGRLLSGVHWFTDIIASIFISMTLLSALQCALQLVEKK